MAPEDVLLETIAMVLRYGDSGLLRQKQCAKLRQSITVEGNYQAVPFVPPLIRDDGGEV